MFLSTRTPRSILAGLTWMPSILTIRSCGTFSRRRPLPEMASWSIRNSIPLLPTNSYLAPARHDAHYHPCWKPVKVLPIRTICRCTAFPPAKQYPSPGMPGHLCGISPHKSKA
ncbi:hypothetical protein RvY_13101-2, partial [Ramazzottius varieornatus]